MATNKPIPSLTPEEIFLIHLLREKPYQEIIVKVQDGFIVSVERKEKFMRKKTGHPFGS